MEVAVCAEYRIPHSEFLTWSKDDRDKAIWHYVRERDRCGRCGTRSAEWDEEKGGDRNAYTPEVRRCRGCEVLDSEEERIKGKPMGRAVFVTLRRRVTRQ